MKLLRLLFIMFLVNVCKAEDFAQIEIRWNPNSIEEMVLGYRLHNGTVSKSYENTIDVGNVTSQIINMGPGKSYFALSAFNEAGESDLSEEVCVQVNLPNECPECPSCPVPTPCPSCPTCEVCGQCEVCPPPILCPVPTPAICPPPIICPSCPGPVVCEDCNPIRNSYIACKATLKQSQDLYTACATSNYQLWDALTKSRKEVDKLKKEVDSLKKQLKKKK